MKNSEEIGDKSGIATSLNNIGILKSDLGLKLEGLELHEKSLKNSKEIGDKSGIANSLHNMGAVKSGLGLKREALDLYEQSLEIHEEIGSKVGIADSLHNMGAVLFENHQEIERACLYFLNSMALYKQLESPNQKSSNSYLFSIRQELGAKAFKNMVLNAIQKLDDELKAFIDLNEILGMPVKVEKKAGRNEPCPCGSGKKYKQCCVKV